MSKKFICSRCETNIGMIQCNSCHRNFCKKCVLEMNGQYLCLDCNHTLYDIEDLVVLTE